MRINFLDYLRIFSFTSVFLGHQAINNTLIQTASDPQLHIIFRAILQFFISFFAFGGAGVVVFFLISGYIITHILQSETTLHFLIKRFFRIYPLYIFAVIIQYAINMNNNPDFPFLWKTFLIQISLLGDFFGVPTTLSGVEWTLRVEIIFYLFMALIKSVYPSLLSSGKAIFLYVFMVVALSIFSPFPNFDGSLRNVFFLYAPFLLMGSVFYLYEKNHIKLNVFLVFTVILFYFYYKGMKIYFPDFVEYYFALSAYSLFLISWIFRNKITSGKLIYILSGMSYSVYLFHTWLYTWLVHQFNSIIIGLLLFFIVCYVLHNFFEKPIINLSKFFIFGSKSKRLVNENSLQSTTLTK